MVERILMKRLRPFRAFEVSPNGAIYTKDGVTPYPKYKNYP